MSNPLRSYSKPLALSHRFAEPLRNHGWHLVYQEKVDGSQFSFGIVDGMLRFRSKRVEIFPDDPGMFGKGVLAITAIKDRLTEGYTYRGEYLSKPKHNTLAYERVPMNHVILYDIDKGHCDYMRPAEAIAHAREIGLEFVPTWECGAAFDPTWNERTSALGGVVVEGTVIKDYSILDPSGKVAMAKAVRASFKEIHGKEWKKANPSNKDVAATITEAFCTEARWRKAVQHLQEEDLLDNAPSDIGKLMKEVQRDIIEEAKEDIKDALWAGYKKQILRGAGRGLPDWYKAKLAEGVA